MGVDEAVAVAKTRLRRARWCATLAHDNIYRFQVKGRITVWPPPCVTTHSKSFISWLTCSIGVPRLKLQSREQQNSASLRVTKRKAETQQQRSSRTRSSPNASGATRKIMSNEPRGMIVSKYCFQKDLLTTLLWYMATRHALVAMSGPASEIR
jgi:hypothetical protein